jgi:hypothetical protein
MLGTLSKLSTALLVTSIGVLVAPSATAAGTTVGTPTNFALTASGYATHVAGGGLPAGSGKTAFQIVSCTNVAGISKWNVQANIGLHSLANLSAASTHTWTTSVHGKVSAWASDKIAKATFVDVAGLGQLSLDSITSVTHAYHNGAGYHATAAAGLGSITVTVLGVSNSFPVPNPGETLVIPGLAEITLGAGATAETASGASAALNAVTVHFLPTNTTVVLAHSNTSISGNVQSALFHGSSTAAQANAAGGAVTLGKTPYLVMNCQGTNGQIRKRSIASVGFGTLGSATELSTSEAASKTTTTANSWQRAHVTGASLLNGSLQISGVTGKVSASYVTGGQVQTSDAGTRIAQVTLDGSVITLPAHGSVDLPGVATLSTDVEQPYANGLAVTALRITLLDGSGVTINLATVKTFIQPSNL